MTYTDPSTYGTPASGGTITHQWGDAVQQDIELEVVSLSTSGHPTTGIWATNQKVIDSDGVIWKCTAGGGPGTWVQTGAYVPAAKTQSTSSETIWSYTPNQPSTPSPYTLHIDTQTFGLPAVTESNLSLGYNVNNGNPSDIAGTLKWLPYCGDTKALEWEFSGQFPDGTGYLAFQFQASQTGNDATKWIFEFDPGTDLSGYFVLNQGGTSPYFIASTSSTTAGNGGVQFPQQNVNIGGSSNNGVNFTISPASGAVAFDLYGVGGNSQVSAVFTSAGNGATNLYLDSSTGTGGAKLNLNAHSTGACTINMQRDGGGGWTFYDAGSTLLYLRDQVNGVMAATFVPGAGTSGYLSLAGGLHFNPATTAVAPGAGSGGALPATPTGYMTINVGGVDRQVAYY